MGKRVFVTGASGRVGIRVVAALVDAGCEVVGLARSAQKAAQVRQAGAACVVGSLADREAVSEGAAGAAVIYHLAGGMRGSGRQTADLVNRQGTADLLAALGGRADLEAVVFTSSVAVYGDRASQWLTEDMSVLPSTRYGRSKVDAEDLLLAAWRERGLPARIIRLAAVYGPGFPFMMADRIAAGRAWLPGEGRNFVPTIHVDDAVSGILKVGEHGSDGEIYNLSDPNPVSVREFYAEVARRVGGRPPRFWSTWVPSYVQFWAARNNERLQSRIARRPLVTPDSLKLFTASSRTRVDRMVTELGMSWKYPTAADGLAATFP